MFLRAFLSFPDPGARRANIVGHAVWRDDRGKSVDNVPTTLEFTCKFVDKPLGRTGRSPVWLVLLEGAANN